MDGGTTTGKRFEVMDHDWSEYATSSHHDNHHAELTHLREENKRSRGEMENILKRDENEGWRLYHDLDRLYNKTEKENERLRAENKEYEDQAQQVKDEWPGVKAEIERLREELRAVQGVDDQRWREELVRLRQEKGEFKLVLETQEAEVERLREVVRHAADGVNVQKAARAALADQPTEEKV